MEKQKQEENKKPKEGERNEDPNMKKADNIEELDNLPEETQEQNDEVDGQDFAKDDKSKDLRSNVADAVKYNDQDMEPNEEEKEKEQSEQENMEPDQDKEMSDDEKDKNLDEIKDNDPIKSLLKTNEFYQQYLEDKNKKEKEEKENIEEKVEEMDDKGQIEENKDVEMEQEDEQDETIQLEKLTFNVKVNELDVLDLKKNMMQRYDLWRKNKDLVANSYELLNRFKKATQHLSISLCEQMRMILEPTEKSRLKGDYKSGKRINIKKIIPFIASNYRNDKIWLRREMPFKRDYRVLIAIDDSLSMKRNNLGFFALESLVSISEALNQLSVGKV